MNRTLSRPPRRHRPRLRLLTAFVLLAAGLAAATPPTVVSIEGDRFFINGRPTYEGRMWRGKKIEGLLMNSRMVQGVFDDLNPETVSRWAYPDTGKWDAERNNREFLAAMPVWRAHGLLAFTINFQGGSPEGYSRNQPRSNPGFAADGTPLPAYLERMARIIRFADDLGMVVVLVRQTRAVPGYTPKPIFFNEDDHFDFDAPANNCTAAIHAYAGWGFFDFRMKDERFADGYQSIPADWTISSPRKAGFFRLLAEITGHTPGTRQSPASPPAP